MAAALSAAPYRSMNQGYKQGTLLHLVMTNNNGTLTPDTARSDQGFTVAGAAGAYTGTCPTGARGVFWGMVVLATPTGAVVTPGSYTPSTGVFAFSTGITSAAAINGGAVGEVWLFFQIEGG